MIKDINLELLGSRLAENGYLVVSVKPKVEQSPEDQTINIKRVNETDKKNFF